MYKSFSKSNEHNTWNQHRSNVDITSIRQKENIDVFTSCFNVFLRCNFDGGKITLFRRTLFDIISMGKVIMQLFDAILICEIFTSFRRTFFDVRWMSQKSTLFRCTFTGVILMSEKPTSFQCTFFKVILTHFSMYYFDAILIKSLF